MSEGRSEPPPVPTIAGPPAVPTRHEPPPVPQDKQVMAGAAAGVAKARHEPPPVPQHLAPAVVQEPAMAVTSSESFILEGANSRAVSGPLAFEPAFAPAEEAPELPVNLEGGGDHGAPLTQWFALLLSFACIPLCLLAAITPLALGIEFWVETAVCAFVGICLGRFAKSQKRASPGWTRLSLQLCYGFLVISLLGPILKLTVPGLQTIRSVSQSAQSVSDSIRESNSNVSWFRQRIDWLSHLFDSSTPAPTPSPSPSPSPSQ